MPRSVALASSEAVQEVAQRALSDGKAALAAALSGFFAGAGESPAVLFSPVSLLVGGLGSGAFAYDGRHRQPGRDRKRPKGLEEGQAVPDVARVAIPHSILAVSMACAFHPGTSLLSVAKPGVQAANRVKSPGRAKLIDLIATRGAAAYSEPSFKKAWIAQFGAVEGGQITSSDLAFGQDGQTRAIELREGFGTPWRDDEINPRSGETQFILVGDAQGLFVALGYSILPGTGPMLEPYGTRVPLTAEPVRRGVPRVSPGASLPHGDRLLLVRSQAGAPVGAQVCIEDKIVRIIRREGTRDIAVVSEPAA